MKRTLIVRGFLVIFMGITLMPLAFYMTGLSFGKLTGHSASSQNVPFGLSHYLDGSFQRSIEEKFERHAGIQSMLVRLDNQLNYSVFNQLSSRYDSQLILGTDNSILERSYLPGANRVRAPNYRALGVLADKLERLNKKLSARGASFLFIISPSKLSFDTEVIPPEYRIAGATMRPDAYDYFLPLLRSREVPFFDSPRFLRELPDHERSLVFSRGGTHWSEFGACKVTSAMLKQLSALRGASLVELGCTISGYRNTPAAMDQDVLRLANLLFPWRLLRQARFPKVKLETYAGEHVEKPRIFIEGTSFCWPILRRLEKGRAAASLSFFYYSRGFFTFPGKHRVLNELVGAAWQRAFAEADIVAIEINQSAIEDAGHGFIDAAFG